MTEADCVYSAVRTGSLNTVHVNLNLKRVIIDKYLLKASDGVSKAVILTPDSRLQLAALSLPDVLTFNL
jgi:hypothetical protein